MRAAIFAENGGPEVVTIEDVETPEPAAGEVRLRVEASAMNHLDLWIRRGLPIDTTMPHIGGSDIVGTVDAVGPGVDDSLVGNRCVVDPSKSYEWYELGRIAGADVAPLALIGEHTQGGFAEFAVVPAANLMAVPEHVDSATAAAAALVGVTAWRGLMTRGALRAGETVLITGASGGVSTMGIQFAKLAGATVHAVTSSAESVARVKELGADFAYDRTAEDWGRAVWQNTSKRGVDLCLDSAGAEVWPAILKGLGVQGRLVSYGATTGPKAQVDIRLLFWRQQSILGSTMGTPAEFREAMSLVYAGTVTPPIHAVLPLEQARAAHEMLEAGQVFGKIVLTP